MKTALDYLAGHWLAFGFIGAALVAFLLVFLLRRRLGRWFAAAGLACAAVAAPSVGALALAWLQTVAPVPVGWGVWVGAAGALVLLVMVVLLLLTGVWSKRGALAAGGAALFGLGGWALDPSQTALASWFATLMRLRFDHPWFLLLLLLAPLTVLIAWRSLFRFESARPWIAATLRTVGVVLLALALARPKVPQSGENVTVLFVVDRSLSVPEEYAGPDRKVDLRQKRLLRFLNDAVAKRNDLGHPRDRAGLIIFGKQPRLELPPSDAPRFNLPPPELPKARDADYTDIGAALKMALASFPEDTAKRIVLISDGNENRGDAEEQAKLARSMGVQIDVVPLAEGQRNEQEVLIERVEAPSKSEQGSTVPIRVQVRSYNPHQVGGVLTLRKFSGDEKPQIVGEIQVGEWDDAKKKYKVNPLQYGLNSYPFPQPLGNEERSYTYEAEFVPTWYEDSTGARREGKPPDDRVENNKASAHVVASGRRSVLILEGKEGDQKPLEEALKRAGKPKPNDKDKDKEGVSKFLVDRRLITDLNKQPGEGGLAGFLRHYDCVILADVPEEAVTDDQQELLRSNTEDGGCGLIMIGGPNSFGAGGWQDTPVEKALPVNCDIKSLKVQGKGGLVLIMHGYEMLDGNGWEKKIAKLAIQRLGPADEVGVIDGQERWHIPFQQIGDERDALLSKLDKLQSDDMPTFDNALKMAAQALNKDDNDPQKQLATKHVIIVSDGDPTCNMALLGPMHDSHITITTVGVATHGNVQNNNLQAIADACPPKEGEKGHFYNVTNPNQLPAIYIQESRLVSQSFIDKTDFQPNLKSTSGPTEGLKAPLQDLHGYVRTTAKPTELVKQPLLTPPRPDQEFPLLAYWHYGLGKAVAFTSDADAPPQWARDWEGANGVYDQFWQQVVSWSLRPTDSPRLRMSTEYHDGKIHVIVDAQTDKGDPDTHLEIRGGVTPPHPNGDEDVTARRLRFVQTNSGRYEATVEAEDAGSYFISAVTWGPAVGKDGKPVLDDHGKPVMEAKDSVPPSAVTLPYSREFSEPETNTPLLEKLRDLTGGASYDDTDAALKTAAESGTVFRPVTALPGESNEGMQPIWQWLLLIAAALLFLDVAVRRVSVDWQKARRRGVADVGAAARHSAPAGQSRGFGAVAGPKGAGRRGAGPRPSRAALRGDGPVRSRPPRCGRDRSAAAGRWPTGGVASRLGRAGRAGTRPHRRPGGAAAGQAARAGRRSG